MEMNVFGDKMSLGEPEKVRSAVVVGVLSRLLGGDT